MQWIVCTGCPHYAINNNGEIRHTKTQTEIRQRTIVDLWVKGRQVQREVGYLYFSAFGYPLLLENDKESAAIQMLVQENNELRARLNAMGVM